MSAVAERLRPWLSRRAVPVTITDLVTLSTGNGSVGTEGPGARNAAVLAHEELSVRFAHQYQRLGQLPFGTDTLRRLHAESVSQLHQSMQALQRHEPQAFYSSAKLFHSLMGMHGTFEQELSEALKDWRRREPDSPAAEVNNTVVHVMSARIGTQTLMRQTQRLLQAAARAAGEPKVPDDGGGAIVKHVQLAPIMEGAIPVAQQLCERAHSAERCPTVRVEGDLETALTCVPAHVSHIFIELLKNALNATAVRKTATGSDCGPADDVVVILAQSDTDCAVRIQDRGNGLPRAQLPLVFDFCYGGSTSAVASEWRVAGATNTPPPLCGLGLGLPTSRLYARHFGGDLAVSGAENGGAEATLWLSRDVHIPEHIPLTCE